MGAWEPSDLPPGQALRKPAPLFIKLDEELIDEASARLEAWRQDWSKLLEIGPVLTTEDIEPGNIARLLAFGSGSPALDNTASLLYTLYVQLDV